MAKSVNKVILLGNIGQDPKVDSTSGGTLKASASLATNDRIKRGDKWEDHTEWHNLVFFGRLAEIVRDYVHKGSKVYVEGRLTTRSWDDHGTTRYFTNIIVGDLSLLDTERRQTSPAPTKTIDQQLTEYSPEGADDIPF